MAVQYDKNTDYQALIDQAVAAGDFKAAGAYEQQRNAKIAGEGITAYQPTYNFGSVYDQEFFTNDELGTVSRLRQADQGGDGSQSYAERVRGGYGYSGGPDGSQYIPISTVQTPEPFSYASAPAYVNRYQALIDQLQGKILNRDPFSYDPEADPAYRQYRDSYTSGGQRAMQDTLGQVSARTGGLASSYAGSAAQQTYDGYMSALADKVPELRQLAYSMYLDEGNTQRQNLNLIAALEREDYAKYQDLLAQYNTDRSFAYGQYRDSVGDGRYQTEWDYQLGRDRLSDRRYEDETDYSRKLQKAKTMAEYGDFSGYEALGYTQEEIEKMEAAFQAARALGAAGSYSGGSYGGSSLGGSGTFALASAPQIGTGLGADYYSGVYGSVPEVGYGGGYNVWAGTGTQPQDTAQPAEQEKQITNIGSQSFMDQEKPSESPQLSVDAHNILRSAENRPFISVLKQVENALKNGTISEEDAESILRYKGFEGFNPLDLNIGPVSTFYVLDLVLRGDVELYTGEDGKLHCKFVNDDVKNYYMTQRGR